MFIVRYEGWCFMEEKSLLVGDTYHEKKDGKHLVFQIGEISYGIPIMEVSEINGLMKITHLPNTPNYIKGVINLRGRIIPVLDLRLKFGMTEKEYDIETCFIIANISVGKIKKQMGVIVDTVSEVFDIPLEEIDAPPEYGNQAQDGFLNGIGKIKGKLVMLLNIKKILNTEEIIKLNIDETHIEKHIETESAETAEIEA